MKTTVQPTANIKAKKYDQDGNGEEVTCMNLRAALKYIEQNPGAELTLSEYKFDRIVTENYGILVKGGN